MPVDLARIEETFGEAVTKTDTAARAAYLDEACTGDPELRQRVEQLLTAHDATANFLKLPDTNGETSPYVPVTEGPKSKIGRYKLLEQIGEGGFGVVFSAEQERPVKRRVALKIIKPGMATREVIARFEVERQALAMMDHPNIAKVHDAGATENGRPYFVMELVQGVPITEYCDQCNLTTRERLELFVTVCQAVQHAHQKGVIHRDIKPTNVLVAMQDGQPAPKIIDFGVAKAIDQQLTEHTLMTAFAQIVGTPLYMSPEQAELSPLGVDTRSDIYSLGVLLYELLAGATPFDKDRLHAAPYDEMRRIIREEEPPRPSARISTLAADLATTIAEHRRTDSRRLSQQVRGELDWIVMKCLEKDRNRRYETPNSLARDIEQYLDDEPVQACPPSTSYRFRKFARRNSALLATTAVVVASLLLGIVVSTWQAIRAGKAEREQSHLRDLAEQARVESESQRTQAEIARAAETKLREDAELREAESRRHAYDSDISLAQKAIGENRLGLAKSLLASHRPQPGQTDLRGWEWRYLWQQTQGNALFQLCQRNNPIYSLATSFDGRFVALGEAIEGGVSVWDLRSRREVAHLPAGDSEVYVAFSPTAPLLAFSSISGPQTKRIAKLQLWDSENQSLVGEIRLGARCLGLAFSADGHALASATAEPEQQIALWQVPAGKKLASFNKPVGGEDEAIPLTVTADAKLAAYGSRDGIVHVCDLTSGRDLWSAKAADDHLIALAFSPDGKTLATGAGYEEQEIRLWDVESGKEAKRLEGHSGWVGGLVFSPDGRRLFSASADRTIRIWDIGEQPQSAPLRILRGHDDEVFRLALLPDGQTLVSSSNDGTVYAWDTASGARSPGDAVVLYRIREWQFTPDNQAVLTLNTHGELKRWRGPDFAREETVLEVGRDFNRCIISADNGWLAIRRNDDTVEVWDLVRRALYRRLAANSGIPWRFLDDGKKLVVFKTGTDLDHVWDVPKGARLETWRRAIFPDREFQIGDISPDGRWCLTIGLNGEAVLRDIIRGREEDLQLGVTNPFGVDYSADSRMFAVTSSARHRYTKVWETDTKREVATLDGGHGVAFSPDGKRLALATGGGCSIWNLDTRRRLVALSCTECWELKFSPDGNALGTRNPVRGELYLWQAPSPEEIQ